MATYLGGDMPIYWPAIEELEDRAQAQDNVDPWASFVARVQSAQAQPTGEVAVPRPATSPTDPTDPI